MKWINIILPSIGVLLIQFFLVDFLSLNMIRPDFPVIYIFFISLVYGRTPGVIIGFTLGLLSDLTGVGSLFGLAPLSLSITAYLAGYLNGKYERLLPYVFHISCVGIVAFHFFIISYVRFQSVYESDIILFLTKWLLSFAYTMLFFLITQFFFPVREASSVKNT